MNDCARRANVETRGRHLDLRQRALRPRLHPPHQGVGGPLGVRWREILSQAGHDAYYVSKVAPTAMIFTPCRDGISHNEASTRNSPTRPRGVDVLLHAVVARADR